MSLIYRITAFFYTCKWVTKFCASMICFEVVAYIIAQRKQIPTFSGVARFGVFIISAILVSIPTLSMVEKMTDKVKNQAVQLVLGILLTWFSGLILLLIFSHLSKLIPKSINSKNEQLTAASIPEVNHLHLPAGVSNGDQLDCVELAQYDWVIKTDLAATSKVLAFQHGKIIDSSKTQNFAGNSIEGDANASYCAFAQKNPDKLNAATHLIPQKSTPITFTDPQTHRIVNAGYAGSCKRWVYMGTVLNEGKVAYYQAQGPLTDPNITSFFCRSKAVAAVSFDDAKKNLGPPGTISLKDISDALGENVLLVKSRDRSEVSSK